MGRTFPLPPLTEPTAFQDSKGRWEDSEMLQRRICNISNYLEILQVPVSSRLQNSSCYCTTNFKHFKSKREKKWRYVCKLALFSPDASRWHPRMRSSDGRLCASLTACSLQHLGLSASALPAATRKPAGLLLFLMYYFKCCRKQCGEVPNYAEYNPVLFVVKVSMRGCCFLLPVGSLPISPVW